MLAAAQQNQMPNQTTNCDDITEDADPSKMNAVESSQEDLWRPSSLSHDEFAQLMLEAMDAFLIVIEATEDANVVYTSESMLPLLGYDAINAGYKRSDSSANDVNENKSVDEEDSEPKTSDVKSEPLSIYDLLHSSDRAPFSKILKCHNGNRTNEFS